MRDGADLRRRLTAAGVDLPAELADMVVTAAGPMITSLDELATVSLDDVEPFVPARRLPDDAPTT
jgi:hypothetical protein